MKKDLLTLRDITGDDLNRIFDLASELKHNRGKNTSFRPLAGKSIGMIFAKSSTRTRVSFAVGVSELGGNGLYLDAGKMQLGRGETVADTAKVLSRYLHGIVIRTFSHAEVEELAREASIPVINALTDDYHPCQILADLFTIVESGKALRNVKMVFSGDGQSNIANSLILGAKLTGMRLTITAPEAYAPHAQIIGDAPNIEYEPDPIRAAVDADYLYTDVFVSMGCEEEREERLRVMSPYQVNRKMADAARSDVKFLHCLPAHRGEEVSADVMDSDMSIVFDEAENRLHVQKAVMAILMK
ncbi:MAG: ornithine carbamoyltransferase [Victivallaceae bacterium]|nr:ornithine carbamoyltransferase [Victivallaceae bacterium]